jgi:hypothetical protein
MVGRVDTREQRPLKFSSKVLVEQCGLPFGDYSIQGFTDRAIIERKAPEDLWSCCGSERERFETELARLREYEHRAVVVESTIDAILMTPPRGRVKAATVVHSTIAWQQDFGVPFVWAGSPRNAGAWVERYLTRLLRKAAEKGGSRDPSEALRMMRDRGYRIGMRNGKPMVIAPADGLSPEKQRTAYEWLATHDAMLRDLLRVEIRCLQHPSITAASKLFGRPKTVHSPGEQSSHKRGTLVLSFGHDSDDMAFRPAPVIPTTSEQAEERDGRMRERERELAADTTAKDLLTELVGAGYSVERNGSDVTVYAPADDPHLEPEDPENPARRRQYVGGPYRNPDRISALLRAHRERLLEVLP